MTVEKPLFIRICKLSYVALHCRKNYIAGTTDYAPRFHMHTLAEQLKAVAGEQEKWGRMMAQTYRALCGRLPQE